ncbi:MAG: hypothetical protein ABI977_06270 [Acidobacteriota bacterium]
MRLYEEMEIAQIIPKLLELNAPSAGLDLKTICTLFNGKNERMANYEINE